MGTGHLSPLRGREANTKNGIRRVSPFQSAHCITTTMTTDHSLTVQIGEGFVRELDFSRIWIRINAADDDSEKEEVIAEYKTDTRAFLEHCLVRPCRG